MERQEESSVKLLEKTEPVKRIAGVVLGVIAKLDESGHPFVEYPSNPTDRALPARSIVKVEPCDTMRDVVLMFEEGDPERPIVMGFLQRPDTDGAGVLNHILSKDGKVVEVRVDGESLAITAQKEIVIRCGKASITLTRAGKVLIRGSYLLSRSSGVNRVKGGSVQIN